MEPTRRVVLFSALAALMVAFTTTAGSANHNATDTHSQNMRKVATFNHGAKYRQGTDLAFWGDLAVLGNYDNPGGMRLLDIGDPSEPRLVGQLACPGPQADVSIWDDLVFMSVDSPRKSPECGAVAATAPEQQAGTAWEGIRIISIADPSKPKQIATVRTDCGSHTHTLVPDPARDRVLIYVLSYPLGAPMQSCNVATHRKYSIVSVPLDKPTSAKVIATPDVSPAIGCHDVSVLMKRKLAAAACITESQLWDISNPAKPKVLSHIVNPAVNIHHSSAFSWDGGKIVIGDELGGAAATPGCLDAGHAPLGAMWFYDVKDPKAPALKGWFKIPQAEPSMLCTAHNFNTVPLKSGRDILVSGWYNGGTTAVDFTNPAAPKQIGYYIPRDGGRASAWSSYWYNGYIFANNFDEDVNSLTAKSRGFDVFKLTDELVSSAVSVRRLNPQTQERIPGVK